MIAREILKAADAAGVHLSTFLAAARLNKSSFYRWSLGSGYNEISKKKMEILLAYLKKTKQLKDSLTESVQC